MFPPWGGKLALNFGYLKTYYRKMDISKMINVHKEIVKINTFYNPWECFDILVVQISLQISSI